MTSDMASRFRVLPFRLERQSIFGPTPTLPNVSGSSSLEDRAGRRLAMAPVGSLDSSSDGTCCLGACGMGTILSPTCRIFRGRTIQAKRNQDRGEEYPFIGRKPYTITTTSRGSSRSPKRTKPQNGASRQSLRGMLPHGLTKPLSPTKKTYRSLRKTTRRRGDQSSLLKEMWTIRKRTMLLLPTFLFQRTVILNWTSQ